MPMGGYPDRIKMGAVLKKSQSEVSVNKHYSYAFLIPFFNIFIDKTIKFSLA